MHTAWMKIAVLKVADAVSMNKKQLTKTALSSLSSFTIVHTANLEHPNCTAMPPYPVMVILKTAFSYLFDKKIQMLLACTCIPACQ